MKQFTLHIPNSLYLRTGILSIIMVMALAFVTGCNPPLDYIVSGFNFTDKSTTVYVARGIHFDSLTEYPDTLLPPHLKFDYKIPNNCDDPELISGSVYLTVWPPHEKVAICPRYSKALPDTASVFIIDTDTLKTYGYEYIAEHYKIICRYDLSREDIRALNYIIPFPPNRTMEHMHMFPSYQEIINKTSNYEE